jgi:hypothetical protein
MGFDDPPIERRLTMKAAQKKLTVLAAVLVVAGGAAGAVLASSSTSTPRPLLRIHLIEREAGGRFVDTGKKGLSVGDQQIGRSDILDLRGKLVGRMDGVCTVTGVGKQLGGVCHGVVTLRGGQIAGEFAWGRSGSSRLQAIVGGTGRYAGARGQFVVDTSGSDAHEPFTIELYTS